MTIYPDRRFELNGGPKIVFGVWKASIDNGFYLRCGARHTGEGGLSRAGHFVYEQDEIVFDHDDEVERFEKIGTPEVAESNGVEVSGVSGYPAGELGTIKVLNDFA